METDMIAIEGVTEISVAVDAGGPMGTKHAGSREKAFSRRLTQALDNHPRCPDEYGRLTWVARELAHHRVVVKIETVRRWLAGINLPRPAAMSALAKMLQVDETWLAMGVKPLVTKDSAARVVILEDALDLIAELTDDQKIKDIVNSTKKSVG